MLQRRTIFHHDERLPVFFVNFMDGADVRVIQGGCRFGLALKSGYCLRVFSDMVWKEPQGNEAIEFDVFSLVNDPHSTAADFLDDAVVRNRATEDGQGIRHFGCILRPVPDNCR